MLYAVPGKSKKITAVERKNDRLYLKSEAGIFRLEARSSRIIRVSYTEAEEFSVKEKPGVIFREVYADWNYFQNNREVIFSTDDVRIVIDTDESSICYYDNVGRKLLKEQGRELEEFTTYRMIEDGLKVEKVATADGVKDVVRSATEIPDGKSYHTRIYFEWDEEALYGLGQQEEGFGSLRGQTVYLHQANRKIAIPMLVSTKGYGILTDTYSPMIFSDTIYGSYIYTEADSEIDYYFMNGSTMEGVIAEYRKLTGQAVMLPKWSFGYLQSQERYETGQEILEIAEEYRRRGIGIDGVILDWCSWKGDLWGQKTLDEERFPKPGEMISRLHDEHIHFMLSIWPNMDEKTDNYKEFRDSGLLLPGCNIYNAFSKCGREMYWKQIAKGLFCHGIDGWWCDNSEPITPEWNHIQKPEPSKMYEEYCRTVAKHLPAEEMNAYGLHHACAVYEGQRAESSKRVLNLTRSAYTGQQRYGTVLWSGDIEASWDTLRKQCAAGLHFCASGLPYWTVDIGAFFVKRGNVWFWKGGYDKTTDDLGYRELFVRWYQWAAFLPMFRGHGTDCRRELWKIANADIPFYDILLKSNKLRYNLMPYIYSYAGLCWLDNGSMMKHLSFVYPHDREVWEITDQYMFGNELMICPVTKPMYYQVLSKKIDNTVKARMVYLPKGNGWYDYWTNTYYEGGRWIAAPAPIERIPVYVREGSIIPKAEPALSTEEMKQEISITVYGGMSGKFMLYEDSGDDYSYEDGKYNLTELIWHEDKKELRINRQKRSMDKEGYIISKAVLVHKEGMRYLDTNQITETI